MSITTNRLKIDFNIEAIARDFAFLRFTRDVKGNWFGAVQLDSLLADKYQAHAVMFQYGKFAYAMFKRPIDTYELIAEIRKDPDFENDAIIEVEPKALRSEEDCICEAWLAQILINSLSASRSRFEQFHFNNLTGALLLVPDLTGKKKDYIDIAKVSLTPDYLLCVNIVRHRKLISLLADKSVDNRNLASKPRYTLNAGTSTLRRWLDDPFKSNPKETYIQHEIKGKKASAPFLDFSSPEAFDASRAGIIHQVLTRIQQLLSDYMTIECEPGTGHTEIALTETILKRPKQLHAKLDGLELRIVDTVQSEESESLVSDLKAGIKPYLPNTKLLTTGKRDKPGALNLRIIHSKDYYEQAGEADKYLPSAKDIQRQHITIENFSGNSAAAVKTVIKELLIKRDISNGRLNLFDWEKLQAKDTWTFGIQDDSSSQIVFMDIEPSGQFSFRKIDGGCLFAHNEYLEYAEIIAEAKKSEWKTGLTLEGLVISGDGHKNLIYRTNEITLPDLERLKGIIGDVAEELPASAKTGYELADLVDRAFHEISDADSNNLAPLIEELKKYESTNVPKNVFRKTINGFLGKNTTVASSLRKYLVDEKHIRLSFPKQRKSLNDLFDASLNINYFANSEREASYFVGERRDNIQYSLKSACLIRKIAAVDGSELIFEKILPTMNVDFVNTGQSTVLPFPFKYLREYLKNT